MTAVFFLCAVNPIEAGDCFLRVSKATFFSALLCAVSQSEENVSHFLPIVRLETKIKGIQTFVKMMIGPKSGPTKREVVSEKAPKNISVFLRIRPPVQREILAKHTFDNLQVDPQDPTKVTVQKKTDRSSVAKTYTFNKVWAQNASQKQVYEDFARGAVDAAFEGQHGVLFVYGQTGSGKTFTISNDDASNLGVLQQAMYEVWGRVMQDSKSEYRCSVSYVQLYNEILTDLLDPAKQRVRLQSADGGAVTMVSETSGLGVEKTVTNYAETMELFLQGVERKEMASTEMNTTSSRSHTIFTFYIHKSTKIRAVAARSDIAPPLDENAPSIALEGRLVLCDLAGSERIAKTHAQGEQIIQAGFINTSLLVLGKVVAALIDKKAQHAPFRESKLTRLLQYSLYGNGNTSIVINVSPSDDNTDETVSAILFGQRAIQIKQEAKRHEVLDYKAMFLQLQADLAKKEDDTLTAGLDEQRRDFEDQVTRLKEELRVAEQQNEILRRENEELRTAMSSPPGKGAKEASPPRPSSSIDEKLINELKSMIKTRDAKVEATNSERLQLGKLFAHEQLKCFKLAQQLQALAVRYQNDMNQLSKRIDELNTELAKARGTDFLTVGGGLSSEDTSATPRTSFSTSSSVSFNHPRTHSDPNSAMSPTAISSPSTSEALGGERMHEAFEVINSLRQEKTDLIVYQRLAEKAIRLLHAEKEALRAKVAQLSTSH